MTRTFIALEMNERMQSHLTGVVRQVATLLPDVATVAPQSIHLTLAFLGELTDGELAGVMHATENAARQVEPFSYRLSHVDIFGSPQQPRVIWIGIEEPSGALQKLHRALARELERRKFPIDKRPFSPHLTLARVKKPLPPAELQQLQRLLAGKQEGILSSTDYPAQSLCVIKSELLRTGAEYTLLREYGLG